MATCFSSKIYVTAAPAIAQKLPDSSFSVSSEYGGVVFSSKHGRLNSPYGWCPKARTGKHFLQIDLKTVYTVCGIATQGHKTINYWTTRAFSGRKDMAQVQRGHVVKVSDKLPTS